MNSATHDIVSLAITKLHKSNHGHDVFSNRPCVARNRAKISLCSLLKSEVDTLVAELQQHVSFTHNKCFLCSYLFSLFFYVFL